ncbi:MAG TPA: hypothetical protein VLF91_05590 [Candidatus Saccharimonadales bacterium]|nr:hypothetical protein [Candidatus Saccharimonadales bacterium]
MNEQHIIYALPKQRTSQSMRSRGALAGFERLDQFLRLHGQDITYHRASLQYFVWVDDKQAIESATVLEGKLFADFGVQKKRPGRAGLFKKRRHYEELFKWPLTGDIQQHLAYIDRLGSLPDLHPRPPLTIVISADFWLKGAAATKTMRSHAIAWLSPTSNTVTLMLQFPQPETDDKFVHYRAALQADCPVQLEDKFFYVQKTKDTGDHSYRKAFPRPAS